MRHRTGLAVLLGLLLVVPTIAFSGPEAENQLDEMPEPVLHPKPECPDAARSAFIEGTVEVMAHVGTTGRVQDVRVVKSVPALDSAAIECVRRWTFKPAQSSGRPVASWVRIPIRFKCGAEVGGGVRASGGFDSHGDESDAPGPGAVARPAPRLQRGEFHINGRPSDIVRVTRVAGNRVEVESPHQWRGSGIVQGDVYWGVFVYRDDAPDPKNRGARGTHLGTIQPSGAIEIVGTFTNRKWPPFRSTWNPARRKGSDMSGSATPR